MRVLLLIALLLAVVVFPAWSKTYSCRDSKGQLHFSDNLQGLPVECLGQEKVVKPSKVDNLNYVPATPKPQGSGIEFEHSVRAADREVKQKKNLTRNLSSRAETLLKRYETAIDDKRRARRVWDNSSRGKIKQADDELARVRLEKQQLLKEMDSARLASRDRQQIEDLLMKIEGE